MGTIWGYMVTRRGFCVSITEVERQAMESRIAEFRVQISHAKPLGTMTWNDKPMAFFQGIDSDFTAWRVTFVVDQNNEDRIYRLLHSGQCRIEYKYVVSRRLETMDEHFSSPYYEETNELGFARND